MIIKLLRLIYFMGFKHKGIKVPKKYPLIKLKTVKNGTNIQLNTCSK